jgi:hypothetical protein
VKRSLVVEAEGGPLGLTIAGANRQDTKLLAETLEAIVVERPEPTTRGLNISVWIRGMTIPPAMKPSPPTSIFRIFGVLARKSSLRRDRKPPLLADGWSNARWHGCQNVVASWCAMRRKPSISWVCYNWPVP